VRVVARAPGKIILFGEHFVVYGKPAIVMAIDKYVSVGVTRIDEPILHVKSESLNVEGVYRGDTFIQVKGDVDGDVVFKPVKVCVDKLKLKAGYNGGLKITIKSEIPVAAGLGSSAALSVAVAAATSKLLGVKMDKNEINTYAFESEKVIHGTPSGIDNTIATFGGILRYQREHQPSFIRVKPAKPLPIVIGNTGVSRSTGKLVAMVRELYMRHRNILNMLMEAYEALVEDALKAIEKGDFHSLGELMNINHGMLWSIGVSSYHLDKLVHTALKAGALGAKLTGAGGGGCMIALTTFENIDYVARSLEKVGAYTIKATTDSHGVKVWLEDEG